MAHYSLIYIANARIPTEKAHGFQIVKMCEAFADNGLKVLLLVPKRKNPIKEEVFSYFGIKKNFDVKRIPVIDTVGFLGPVGYWLENLTFSLLVNLFLLSKMTKSNFIFTRDILSGFMVSFFTRKIIFEMHDFPRSYLFFWKSALKRMAGIISTNRWKADRISKIFIIDKSKILAMPNGFDPRLFPVNFKKDELRRKLDLPLDKVIALYSGHLYGWKGAQIMASAATFLPEVIFVFVGGTAPDLALFRKKFGSQNNILIVGHKLIKDVPFYLLAADILILPNSAKTEESTYGTSPIKLFSYMASNRPIIASDLPSIREIVSDKEVLLVRPDDPAAIKEGILKLIGNPGLSESLAAKAKIKSAEFTWQKRADRILNWSRKVL